MIKKEFIALFVGLAIGIAVAALSVNQSTPVGGSLSQVRSTSATSSVLTISSDGELLATSSRRTYARVVNNCSVAIYLNVDGVSASLSDGFYLSANGGVWDTGVDGTFVYTGAVHASSTNQTSCSVYVEEYN